MPEAKLFVRVFNGARQPFEQDVLITLFDGAQRRVHWAFHDTPFTEFTIPVTDSPQDSFRIVVGAKDHRDAGQASVRLKAGTVSFADVMLLHRRSGFVFQPLDALEPVHEKLKPLVTDFLMRHFNGTDQKAYEALQRDNEDGLATLLSIASGFDGFGKNPREQPFKSPPAFKSHPLDFANRLTELRPDRFFAEASADMVTWLRSDNETFHKAPHGLHPNAFLSFKEQRFPEGNVQFTFAKTPDEEVLELDSDIDLFKDQGSHFFLEVFPSDVLHVIDHTDPRDAYALRWMSAQQARAEFGVDFNPPYAVVPA